MQIIFADNDYTMSLIRARMDQWRSQKFVMEGVQNGGLIGAGEGGVSGEGVSLP